jgi:integrase
VKVIRLAEAAYRRDAPPELWEVRAEIEDLADHERPVNENSWRGIFIDEKFTRYIVSYYALERDRRGKLHKVQHTKTFRRDGPHIDADGEQMLALAAAKQFKRDRDIEIVLQRERAKDATLDDVFAQFIEMGGHRPSTRSVYEYVYRKHIGPKLGSWTLLNLDIRAVERWYADLDAGSEAKAKAGRLLRALTSFAYRRDMIPSDPARVLRIPSSSTRSLMPDEIPTINDVHRLAEEIPDRYMAMVYCLAIGGLRIGEAVALRMSRVDFKRHRLTVDSAWTEAGGFGPPKTKAGVRTFTMPPPLEDDLRRHVETYTPTGDPERLVFTTETDGPVRSGNWRRRVFGPAAKRAGLEGLDPQDLRHVAASDLASDGASAVEIAARLGHSNSSVTHRVYLHLLRSRDEALAASQGARWERPPESTTTG